MLAWVLAGRTEGDGDQLKHGDDMRVEGAVLDLLKLVFPMQFVVVQLCESKLVDLAFSDGTLWSAGPPSHLLRLRIDARLYHQRIATWKECSEGLGLSVLLVL